VRIEEREEIGLVPWGWGFVGLASTAFFVPMRSLVLGFEFLGEHDSKFLISLWRFLCYVGVCS
jgi:hypothetical protein